MSTYSVIVCPEEKLDPYRAFIYAKWLRSLRYGNEYFRLVEPMAFWQSYREYITAILNREDTDVRLAVLTDEPDVALGFSVSRGTILDYVYVQKDMRRLGIGASLVPKGIDTVTHLTRTGITWWSKTKDVIFNPFV